MGPLSQESCALEPEPRQLTRPRRVVHTSLSALPALWALNFQRPGLIICVSGLADVVSG